MEVIKNADEVEEARKKKVVVVIVLLEGRRLP